MKFVIDKLGSIVHRVKTNRYKRSSEWKMHPLNKEMPKTEDSRIEESFHLLSNELPCLTIDEFHVNDMEYIDFKKQVNPGLFYAAGFKGKKSYIDKKIMEHFVSYKLTDLRKGDFYIDVSSEHSPFPKM